MPSFALLTQIRSQSSRLVVAITDATRCGSVGVGLRIVPDYIVNCSQIRFARLFAECVLFNHHPSRDADSFDRSHVFPAIPVLSTVRRGTCGEGAPVSRILRGVRVASALLVGYRSRGLQWPHAIANGRRQSFC